MFDQIQLRNPVVFENLAIFPLTAVDGTGRRDYLLLDEAVAGELLVIKERSSGATVPELEVTNSADQPVLILDGEELLGAKQNRVLNLTVLVPAHSITPIPVSCVEAGRWHARSAQFRPAPRVQYASARAAKSEQVTFSLRRMRRASSDQGAVWDDIARKSERLGSFSPTSAMAAMYEKHAHSLEDYVRALELPEGAVGFVCAIKGQVFALDLFDHPETLRKAWPKLVRGYALDALDPYFPRGDGATLDEARRFLDEVEKSERFETEAAGLGTHLRLQSDTLAGGGLRALGRLLHLYAFRKLQAPQA